jgi:hypothetical protein
MATPEHYSITFSGSTIAGTLPTGSFDYDPAAPTFSNFLVAWDGLSFDLTGAANSPVLSGLSEPVCGASGAALSFLLLNDDPCLTTENVGATRWELGVSGQDVIFSFIGGGGPAGELFFSSVQGPYASVGNCSEQCGQGLWQVARSVPEPGTLTLLGLGLAGLAVLRRRKQ